MKKVIAVLAVLIALLLVAGFVFVLLFMEEPDDTILVDSPNSQGQSGQPQLNVPKEIVTQADELDALDAYTQRNQDTVGWLRVPGTTINNCVLQAHDNAAYLRTNELREYDIYGCYFADWECSVGAREDFSPNTVIYGHSDLKDNPEGPRFSQLFHFTDPEFAKETPTISFSTLEGGFMEWEVFAVFYTEKTFDYISARPEGGVDQLAKACQEKSLYNYDVTVGPEDKILTLSTCTVKYGAQDNSHRFVVMARLLPDGAESPETARITAGEPAEPEEPAGPSEPAA